MKKAPWKDFAGNSIFEGSVIKHPTGETGKVIFLPRCIDPHDQWRVVYDGDEKYPSRLCLQIGAKGQAVVI